MGEESELDNTESYWMLMGSATSYVNVWQARQRTCVLRSAGDGRETWQSGLLSAEMPGPIPGLALFNSFRPVFSLRALLCVCPRSPWPPAWVRISVEAFKIIHPRPRDTCREVLEGLLYYVDLDALRSQAGPGANSLLQAAGPFHPECPEVVEKLPQWLYLTT